MATLRLHKGGEDANQRNEARSDFRRGVHARGSIALFSVALLWCSSLSSCGALVDLVLPGAFSLENVGQMVNATLHATRRTEEEYAACATRQADACMRRLQEGRIVELARASSEESRNNDTVARAKTTASRCASLERSIVTTLRSKEISWRGSCSDEVRAEVHARIRLPEDALTPVSEAYRWNSESRLNRTLGLLSQRTTYDAEYAQNKTAFLGDVTVDVNMNVTESLAAMAQQVSENVGSMDVAAGANIVAMAVGAANRLAETRDITADAVNRYVGTVVDYVGEVTDTMAKIGAWFEVFNGLGAVLDTINIGVTPSATVPLPPALQIGAIPNMPPDVSGMVQELTESASAMSAEISRIADDVRIDLAADASAIPRAVSANMNGVPNMFDDYDPPPRGDAANFSAVIRDDAKTDGDAFENKTAELVASFENERIRAVEEKGAEALSRANASDPVAAAAAGAADIRAKLGAAADNAAEVDWLGVSPPDIAAFSTATDALNAVVDGLVAADMAYRFARSFQHIARHLSPAGSVLPPVDLTRATRREETSILVKIAGALGHPACLAAVRAVAASLAVALIAVAYMPFHSAFSTGCLNGCSGTFVTNNLHSLAHNYAAAGGSRELSKGLAAASTERRDICARHAPITAAHYEAARLAIEDANTTRAMVTHSAELLLKCVDLKDFTFDAESFQTECRDGEGLTTVASIDPFAVFDCDKLPKCAATCVGPVRRILSPLAHVTGCAAEGALHSAGLRTVIVALVFFSANAARDIAVRGVTAVSWRKLSGDSGFRFQGSLREDGTTLKPETSGSSVRQVARAKLRNVAARHELGGYGLIIFALLSQAPGLVALFFARESSLVIEADCGTSAL